MANKNFLKRTRHLPLRVTILCRFARLCLIGFTLLASSSLCWASTANIYVAQSGIGAANGADCTDAYGYGFFNNSANWGASAGQIGPGTTVHVCGTFSLPAGTQVFIFQGSGTSGNPITLLFESGALLTEPYGPCCNSAYINVNGNNYVTIDGNGTNWPGPNAGTITASANGSALANRQGTYGIQIGSCTGCIVEHMNITNLYVRSGTGGASEVSCGNACVRAIDAYNSPTNLIVENNTIHDCEWCIDISGGTGTEIGPNNTVYNADHDVAINSTVWYVFGNYFYSWGLYDTSDDSWHHDGIHCFAGSGGQTQTAYVYNNYFDGVSGSGTGGNMNQFVFYEGAGSSTTCFLPGGTSYTFNNVMLGTESGSQFPNLGGPYGNSTTGNTGDMWVNNTGLGNSTAQNPYTVQFEDSNNMILENNAIGNTGWIYLNNGGSSWATIDYNAYEGCTGSNCFPEAGGTNNFATWQTDCSCDAHTTQVNLSSTSYFNLDSTGHPLAGSPVIGKGANLTSVCSGQPNPGLGALCFDKNGTQRPTSGPWDIGAYQFSGSVTQVPVAPTQLIATVD